MACGHIFAAVRSGMAECTPNFRASQEAAETTPRSCRWPPTTTGLPFSDGSNSSSTETKKASMSTWKIVLEARVMEHQLPRDRLQVGRLNAPRGKRATHLAYAFVNPDIFFRRSLPGEVFAHAVAHDLLPGSLIAKYF